MDHETTSSERRELDFSLISKITERCNLNCGYCYMSEKKDLDMPQSVVKKLIKSFLDFNNEFAHFTWIGGEPLLRPDSFFKNIIDYELNYNLKEIHLSNSIQTNGLLLSPERLDYLKELGFKVGVSYDGTEDLQRQRMNPVQTKKLLKNIEYAKGKVGLLAVLTRNSINKEEEIYNFFRDHTTFAKINFFSPTGYGSKNTSKLMLSPNEASNMLVNFYELWKEDTSALELRPQLEMVRSFFTGFPVCCDFSAVSCYKIVGSDPIGDIYPCSKAMNFHSLRMGNISEGLENLIGSDIHQMPLRRYLSLKKKENNVWFNLSSGGCPIEALSFTGNYMNPTTYSNKVRNVLFKKINSDLKDANTREYLERKVGLIN